MSGVSGNDSPIGVFNSGPGGLAVLREIRRLMPAEDLIYVADTARQPYGTRLPEEVSQISIELAGYLVSLGVKVVVIACNTASIAGGATVEKAFPNVPVIGMIDPAVKRAVHFSGGRRIAVWGTELTVDSGAYAARIHEVLPEASVLGVAPSELLRLAEKGDINGKAHLASLVSRYLEPVDEFDADTLLLGCTDLTCVRDLIDAAAAGRFVALDPAEAVADEVSQVLGQTGMRKKTSTLSPEGSLKFQVTGDQIENFARFALDFLDMKDIDVEHLDLKNIKEVG